MALTPEEVRALFHKGPRPTTTKYVRIEDFPRDLHKEMKALAASDGMKIGDEIIVACRYYLAFLKKGIDI